MDSELKEDIKFILRQRCDELGLEYFDSEQILINKLSNHVNEQKELKRQMSADQRELEQLQREIELRKGINQQMANASTSSNQK